MPQSSRMIVTFWACCCHSASSVLAARFGTQPATATASERANFFIIRTTGLWGRKALANAMSWTVDAVRPRPWKCYEVTSVSVVPALPDSPANRLFVLPVERSLLRRPMNQRLLRGFIPAICTIAVASPAATVRAQTLSAAAAQEDFDVLWKSVREAHGGLHRYTTAAELDRRTSAHRARLGQPMSVIAFSRILSESLAELRDGHARLEFDSVTNASLATASVLPLRVAIEGEKLIVTFNDSPSDTTIKPGMEIVSVNGRISTEIIRSLLPAVSGDGFIETGKLSRLAREFATRYWLYVEQTGTYRVVVRDADGGQRSATLTGILERDRRQVVNPVNAAMTENFARLDGPRGNVSLEFPGDGKVARLRVRAFDGQAFPATLDSAFRVLRERGTTALVLDLRGNGGGVDEYGALLVSCFVERPFRYFEYIRVSTIAPSFATWLPRTFDEMRTGTVRDSSGGFRITSNRHRGVAEQPPGATPFAGKVAVLIDGGTFSTAADVAAQLRSMGRATFIGE